LEARYGVGACGLGKVGGMVGEYDQFLRGVVHVGAKQ